MKPFQCEGVLVSDQDGHLSINGMCLRWADTQEFLAWLQAFVAERDKQPTRHFDYDGVK